MQQLQYPWVANLPFMGDTGGIHNVIAKVQDQFPLGVRYFRRVEMFLAYI